MSSKGVECEHCDGEGIIEPDNNGPIGDCPVCDGEGTLEVKGETKEELASPSEIAIRLIARWGSKKYISEEQKIAHLQLIIVGALEEIMGAE